MLHTQYDDPNATVATIIAEAKQLVSILNYMYIQYVVVVVVVVVRMWLHSRTFLSDSVLLFAGDFCKLPSSQAQKWSW